MTELVDQDIKTAFHLLKKPEETLHMSNRDTEPMKKIPTELPDMKMMMHEMKQTLA